MDNIRTIIKTNGQTYSVRINRARIFSPKEWLSFLEIIREKNRFAFTSLLNTGARISELLNIKKCDIDFDKKTITLRITKRRTPFSDGHPRVFKVSSQYLNKLKEYTTNLKQDDYLFIDNSEKDLKKKIKAKSIALSQMMKRALKRTNISDWNMFSLHNIRKTAESWMVYLNVNPLVLSKHFGHDTLTALKHYIQPDLYNSEYKYQAREILGDLYM